MLTVGNHHLLADAKAKKSVKKGGAKITLHSSCHDKQLKLFTI